MEYLHLTDKLVHQITHGVEVVDAQTHERVVRKPDTVIFLDKSARPVSWLLKESWQKLAAEDDGSIPDLPEIRYLNIDREQWINTVDPTGAGIMDVSKIDESVMRSLRSVFVEPKYKQDGLTEAIDTAPNSLDGKTVLIVDEVMASGRTLDIAQKMIARAFPGASVAATHWMSGLTTKRRGLAVGNADLPVWYREDTVYGRGVGNREVESSKNSQNLTQRLGRWFLSTRLPSDDPSSEQLRQELKMLANDLGVPIRPDLDRPDYEARVGRLNGKSFEQAQADIMAVARHGRKNP